MPVQSHEIASTQLSGKPIRLADRFLSSNLLKIAAVVAIFCWYPLHASPWYSIVDPDVWWHMRSGEWILQHHQLPRTDPFSITGAGKPWIAYSWPFGVLIHLIARNWDLLGVVGYTIGAWVVLTATLFWVIRCVLRSFWPSLILTFLGGVVLDRAVAPRPGNFTILFFLLVLGILLTHRRTSRNRLLLLLPVLLLLWVNVHLQFIYGLVLIGTFALEPVLDRLFLKRQIDQRRTVLLWATLVVSTLVTTITPYGLGVWRVIADFLHQPKQYLFVAEFHPMAFDRKVHYVVLFLCISAALCLGQKRRKEPAWLLLFAWAAVQGFHMERDIWVLTVISLVTVAMWLSERKPSPDKTPPTVWLAAAACILAILIYSFKTGPSNRELLARAASQLPVGAVAFIHEHHLQGPIFNHFDWGGFLIYTLPEFPVSIDGRTNVHDQDELEHSFDTWDLVGNWHEDPLLVNANLVIGSPAFALSHALRLDPRFELVFNDGVSVVYQKVKPDLHNNPAQ